MYISWMYITHTQVAIAWLPEPDATARPRAHATVQHQRFTARISSSAASATGAVANVEPAGQLEHDDAPPRGGAGAAVREWEKKLVSERCAMLRGPTAGSRRGGGVAGVAEAERRMRAWVMRERGGAGGQRGAVGENEGGNGVAVAVDVVAAHVQVAFVCARGRVGAVRVCERFLVYLTCTWTSI